MRIDSAIITGSFSINGDTFNDLGAYTTTGSNTFVGNQSIVGAVSASALTGSIDFTNLTNVPTLVSGSEQIVSILSPLNLFTASNSTTNTFTSSATARLNSIETITASNISRLTNLESITGSLATTGSNTFIGTQTITGSLFISSNLIVQGTSSLQNITASAVSIGTNLINLNTANPAIRYAGLVIGDSGSVGGSGSFLYDSVQDEMIFVHRGTSTVVTSSVTLMGPQTFDNIGSETYPTSNIIQKGTGNEHLVDSCIFDNGTTTCIKNNLIGTGTACFGSTICSTNISVSSGELYPRIRVQSTNIGSSAAGFELADTSGTQWAIAYDKAGSGLQFFKEGAGNKMYLTNCGCLGIGTTLPIASLQICAPDSQFRISGDTRAQIILGTSAKSWQFETSCGTGNVQAGAIGIIEAGSGTKFQILPGGIACFSCQICAPSFIGGTINGTTAIFSNSIDVATSGSFGFQDYRTQATQKVLVLRGEGVSGAYATSLFNIYTKPGTTVNGIASIIIKSKYGSEAESGNLFEFKGDGAAIFSSGVQATTLALGSVTPSTNGIYLNVPSANGANYGYIRTNCLTVNTTQLILGSTYGYNTPVDALTIFNGSGTFASSVTAPTVYAKYFRDSYIGAVYSTFARHDPPTSGAYQAFCASQGAVLYITSMHNNGRSTTIINYSNGPTGGMAYTVINQTSAYGPANVTFSAGAGGWLCINYPYGGQTDFMAQVIGGGHVWGAGLTS